MQITFAGTIIAQEPTEGGQDAIQGFMTKRKANVQYPDYIRAKDDVPIARLNRRRTLTGTIVYGPFSTLSAAAQKLLLNYDALPDSGPLLITVGGISTIFGVAILETCDAVKRQGVTVSSTLTFQVGPGLNIGGGVLTDENGVDLTDQNGINLTS